MDTKTVRVRELIDAIVKSRVKGWDGKSVALFRNLIAELGGMSGFCALLGQRETTGTVSRPPFPLDKLLESFNAPHERDGSMTVGSKAMSKHAPRSKEQWWGKWNGNNKTKNLRAHEKVVWLLKEAVWMNTHHLPSGEHIYEARVLEGYGCRWVLPEMEDQSHPPSAAFFRGFLEPQTADGHANKWRH